MTKILITYDLMIFTSPLSDHSVVYCDNILLILIVNGSNMKKQFIFLCLL
jgi:hypothetical protein